jgi:hypothetical protein
MAELIALIVLICSLIGIGIILFRKIPLLLELPETIPSSFNWQNLFFKIKNLNPFKGISIEILLQKILSKIRILTLKTDNKTSSWLQKLREKSQKKKIQENDNYWQELKKSTNQGVKKKKTTTRPPHPPAKAGP